jgi:hypothetical protein
MELDACKRKEGASDTLRVACVNLRQYLELMIWYRYAFSRKNLLFSQNLSMHRDPMIVS